MADKELIDALDGILNLLDSITDQHEDGFTHYNYNGSEIDYKLLAKQKIVFIDHLHSLRKTD